MKSATLPVASSEMSWPSRVAGSR